MHRLALLVAAAALAAPSIIAAAEVENPTYASWSKYKVGTTVVHRAVTGEGRGAIETKTTSTLIELTDAKAVVEQVVVSDATGSKVESAPQRFTHRQTFPLLPGVKKEDIGKPSGAIDRGEEALDVAGKSYKSRWYDTKGQTEAGPSITRTWLSDDVPGRLVKAVTKVPAAKKVTTMELVEIKSP